MASTIGAIMIAFLAIITCLICSGVYLRKKDIVRSTILAVIGAVCILGIVKVSYDYGTETALKSLVCPKCGNVYHEYGYCPDDGERLICLHETEENENE